MRFSTLKENVDIEDMVISGDWGILSDLLTDYGYENKQLIEQIGQQINRVFSGSISIEQNLFQLLEKLDNETNQDNLPIKKYLFKELSKKVKQKFVEYFDKLPNVDQTIKDLVLVESPKKNYLSNLGSLYEYMQNNYHGFEFEFPDYYGDLLYKIFYLK